MSSSTNINMSGTDATTFAELIQLVSQLQVENGALKVEVGDLKVEVGE